MSFMWEFMKEPGLILRILFREQSSGDIIRCKVSCFIGVFLLFFCSFHFFKQKKKPKSNFPLQISFSCFLKNV